MKSKLVGVWNSIQFLNNRDIWFSPDAGVKLGIKYSGGTESLKSFYIVYKELIKKNFILNLHLNNLWKLKT